MLLYVSGAYATEPGLDLPVPGVPATTSFVVRDKTFNGWSHRSELFFFLENAYTETSYLKFSQTSAVNIFEDHRIETGAEFLRSTYYESTNMRKGLARVKYLYFFDPRFAVLQGYEINGNSFGDPRKSHNYDTGFRLNFRFLNDWGSFHELAHRYKIQYSSARQRSDHSSLLNYHELYFTLSDYAQFRLWLLNEAKLKDIKDSYTYIEPGVDVYFNKYFYQRTAFLYLYRTRTNYEGDKHSHYSLEVSLGAKY